MPNRNADFDGSRKQIEDALDPEKWRVAAAVALGSQSLEYRQAIVAAGEEEFVRIARRGFSGQGFRTEDLKHIFRAIKRKTQAQAPVIFHA